MQPSPARLAFYNAVPSVLWSVLSLGPLSFFCYQYVARPWLYGLLALSLLAYAVPKAWFSWWQLSQRPAAYRQLGVPLVNHLAQHGGLVNELVRRRYPQYRRVRGRRSGASLRAESYHMERFHVAAGVFFLLMSGYAAAQGRWGWAALLALLNVGYNLYPIWLQQYLRLRLELGSRDFRS
ncbi:glycosyl-4,4'-diaponeurosporenoate acyltransferase CrtO family protein [Hymenobacter guriensis]|uniref:Glycosyl-4,4'-diaponeurosporenoate acyltransferase n=1 Tax=Hymenobacter guriensis TaxID=2793065 RepID=A0ABS0L8B5_9BACT|nr:hypothetical protein [Hymenobacter guriensis]MBG8556389.1 hypothetical protein [Hymenobacter guriensis]